MNGSGSAPCRAILLGIAGILLAGCLDTSADSSAPGEDDDTSSGDPDTVDLGSAQLSRSSALPLDQVEITGLGDDTDTSELYVSYEVRSGEIPDLTPDPAEPRVMPLIRLDDGVFTLAPLLDTEGATIEMRVTDGDDSGNAMSLTIDALPPPRPNAMTEVKQAMEDNLQAATEELGKDYPEEWEHWSDNMSQMPDYLLPLMRTWMSLENWPDDEFDTETEDLLARILAAQPLIEQINDQAEMMTNEDTALSEAAEELPVLNSTMSLSRDGVSRQARNDDGARMNGVFPIQDAAQLAHLLNEYDDTKSLQRDIETFDETVGTYLTAVATVGSLPAGPKGAAAISSSRRAALEAVSNIAGNVAGTAGVSLWFLPSTISELDTTLDPADGQIDEEDREENQLVLVDATATAESDTVDIGEEVINRLAENLTDRVGEAVNDEVVEVYGEGVASEITDYGYDQASSEFLDRIQVSQELTFEWTGIDFMMGNPQKWLDHEATTFSGGGRTIIKHDAGVTGGYEFNLRTPDAFTWPNSLLRFETDRDEIPRTTVDSTPVHLDYISLDVNPPYVSIEADRSDPVEFSITVENSVLADEDKDYIDTDPNLTPDVGSVNYTDMDPDGTLHFEYVPPEDGFPPDTIVRVNTRSTTDRGIRGDEGAPPRSGTFRITTEADLTNIRVVPGQLCLEEGENKTFEAINTLSGAPLPDGEVTWEASAGSIDGSGNYTAPGGDGDRTITASTENDEGDILSDSATVTTGDCTCQWEAQLSYPKYSEDSQAGPSASLSLVFDGNAFTGVHMTMESPDGPGGAVSPDNLTGLFLAFDDPIPMERTGPFETSAQINDGGGVFDGTPDNPYATAWLQGEPFGLIFPDFQSGSLVELPPLQVNIDSMAPIESENLPDQSTSMKGRIAGQVGYPSDLFIDGNLIPGAGPAEYAQFEANFQGVFSFLPTNNTINCQAIN